MKSHALALAAIGLSLGTSLAFADAPAAMSATTPAVTAPKIVKPGALTCEEFLTYDDVTRPEIVYWAEGASKKGKPGEAIIDVDRTNTLVPMVIDECTHTPKAAFIAKEHEASKKASTSTKAK
jgi:acid stress chaperone HdeA